MGAVAAQMSLADAIEMQNRALREGEVNDKTGRGGFRVLGRLIELRHERPQGGQVPARAVTDKVGICLDWKHFHNGPPIGMDKTRTQILILDRVPALPEIPDPEYTPDQWVEMNGNRVPLGSVPRDMYASLGISDEVKPTPKIKQRFIDHANGTFGDFLVIGPLTQALYKIDGVPGFALIDFSHSIHGGDSPMFLLNPGTGEGHILGGHFVLR